MKTLVEPSKIEAFYKVLKIIGSYSIHEMDGDDVAAAEELFHNRRINKVSTENSTTYFFIYPEAPECFPTKYDKFPTT